MTAMRKGGPKPVTDGGGGGNGDGPVGPDHRDGREERLHPRHENDHRLRRGDGGDGGERAAPAPDPGLLPWLKERAELAVSLLLLVLGLVVLWDTATMPDLPSAENQAIGPKAVPTAVGAGLLLCALLHAIDVLRGGRGEQEGGEDVDPDAKPDYKAVGLLVIVFLGNALLIEHLGWAITGGLLFWGTAFALGSRAYVRDVAISATLSVGSFYAFYYGLGITLPPGVLKGIL